MPITDKWEYNYWLAKESTMRWPELHRECLNHWGNLGWELVSIARISYEPSSMGVRYKHIFKKARPEGYKENTHAWADTDSKIPELDDF